MKFRNLLLAIALLSFGFAVPMGFSQDQDKAQDKDKASDKGSPSPADKSAPAPSQSDPSAQTAPSTPDAKPDAKDDTKDADATADTKDADPKDVKETRKIITPADPDRVKHDGGKMDVDAVGNRNVGCGRGLGNWYSIERQVAMGKSYAQQVE